MFVYFGSTEISEYAKKQKAELQICFFGAFLLFLPRHLTDRPLNYAFNPAPYRESSKKAKKHQNLISKKAALNSKKRTFVAQLLFCLVELCIKVQLMNVTRSIRHDRQKIK